MPWASIGSTNTGEIPGDESWIDCRLEIAKAHIDGVCGTVPPGCKFGILSKDHEFGSYPSIGVWYEYEEPGEYVNACRCALDVLNSAIDWYALTNLARMTSS